MHGIAVLADGVADGDERQLAGASFFLGDLEDFGVTPRRFADHQGLKKLHAGAGEHSPRQLDGRHKTTAFGMAVRPSFDWGAFGRK